MIRMEIVERRGAKLRKRLIDAMRSGELRTFTAADRGRKVTHLRYPGQMRWADAKGTIIATMRGARGESPWQLLGAFLGRLAHKYSGDVESIRIEFGSARPAKRARGRRPGAARRKPVTRTVRG